jgi:hypothetical protein
MVTVTSTGEGGWIVRDELGKLVADHSDIAGFLEVCEGEDGYALEVYKDDSEGDDDPFQSLQLSSFVPGKTYTLHSDSMSTPDGGIVMCIGGDIHSFRHEREFEHYLYNIIPGAIACITSNNSNGENNIIECHDVYAAPFWTMYTVYYICPSTDEDDDSTTPRLQ